MCARGSNRALLYGPSGSPLGAVVSRLALVLASVVGLVGCFPYHYTLRSGVTGVVLDSATSAPIANATVTIRTRDSSHQTGEVTATTASDGAFRVVPKQRWGIYVVPMDVWGPWSEASVLAPGYQGKSLKLNASAMGPKDLALGDVRLTRDR